MSLLRKYKKAVKVTTLRFDPDMYNNVLGSLIITHYILDVIDENNTYNIKDIKKTWRKLVKKPQTIDFWLGDKDFIPKALALFGMKPEYGRFAMAQSRYNILFVPYLNETPLPIREDGLYPRTVLTGKIYPVEEVIEKEDPTKEDPINDNIERDKE